MDYRVLLAAVAVVIGSAGFVPYYRDVLKRSTKPHVYTWAIWSLLTGLTFVIQLSEKGGAGAWVTGIESATCIGIFILSFSFGEKTITRTDTTALILALLATILWLFAKQPLLAVLLVSTADALGYVPTLRKSFTKPLEETVMLYVLSAIHWLISIVSLGSITLVTVLYPAGAAFFDIVLISLILMRRRQLASHD